MLAAAALKKILSWGSDLDSDPPAAPRLSAKTPAVGSPAAQAAAPSSSPRTSDLLNPAYDPVKKTAGNTTTVTALPSANALKISAARRRVSFGAATPCSGTLTVSFGCVEEYTPDLLVAFQILSFRALVSNA